MNDDKQKQVDLAKKLSEFSEFINEPPQYEDKRMVRDYRHELARKWVSVFEAIQVAMAASAAECASLRAANNTWVDMFGPAPRALMTIEKPYGEILDDMDHQAKYQSATVDPKREQELRIQALGAALSRRDWHAAELAYEAIRDKFSAENK